MSSKTVTGLVILLAAALGLVLFVSDRSISRVIEDCGDYISRAVGL
ncbi:MAG TPA: hypothetical protein VFH15_10270 [Pyrinomonadaceae bacterium]|nr:hypothetical protein [Pyrinomonadaceae bacterium]